MDYDFFPHHAFSAVSSLSLSSALPSESPVSCTGSFLAPFSAQPREADIGLYSLRPRRGQHLNLPQPHVYESTSDLPAVLSKHRWEHSLSAKGLRVAVVHKALQETGLWMPQYARPLLWAACPQGHLGQHAKKIEPKHHKPTQANFGECLPISCGSIQRVDPQQL